MSYEETYGYDYEPTSEEMISDADEARMEHERGERESERAETWAAIEAQHGPLHRHAYAAYEGMAWKD